MRERLSNMVIPVVDSHVLTEILIVDDRPDNILAMEVVLGDSPQYKLFSAQSGKEAIEMVRNHDFALILLDIQMPEMDGYEAARQIKKLERGRDVPIIMVTAIYKEDPKVLEGYMAGAIDYVGKPFNEDVLKAKVGVYSNLYLKSRQVQMQNQFLAQAEKALKSEKYNRQIIETMPVGVIVADSQGAINQMNAEAVRIWGGPKTVDLAHYNEFAGRWSESGKPLGPEDWALARAVVKGEVSQYEVIEIQCFDGTKKIILNSASPIRNSHGEITGAVDVMQDITLQKNLPLHS
jgi:CheY-like chemotaxis protein